MNLSIKEIDIQDIGLVKELWEELNEVHFIDSTYFKDHFRDNTFEKRCRKFTDMISADFMGLVVVNEVDSILGYCISTIDRATFKGEIDSIFIRDSLKGMGLGTELIDRSIRWMKENRCSTICVSVADGHESVFGFYMKQGFFPRLTYLELKDE